MEASLADDNSVYQAEVMGNMFGPNPYAPYQNVPLPWPSSYMGTPTDAMGQPIQAQGTTLNSMPLSQATPPAAPAPTGGGPQFMGPPPFAKLAQQAQQQAGVNPTTGVASDPQAYAQARYYRQMAQSLGSTIRPVGAEGSGRGSMMPPQPATPMFWQNPVAPKPSGPPPGAMGLPSALSMLANPGNPVTPGATVPQSQPRGMQPSVLGQFLNSNQGGAAGGGMTYNNQPFFSTLRSLQAGG
jgi:hypothetical protein